MAFRDIVHNQSHMLHILNITMIKILYTELVYDKIELHSDNFM